MGKKRGIEFSAKNSIPDSDELKRNRFKVPKYLPYFGFG
jgi:hypothetical protein